MSPLQPVRAFLAALTHRAADGRVVQHLRGAEPHLKFMLLNPAAAFEEVLTRARAVVVAGGTMGPLDDFARQLVSPTLTLPAVRRACGATFSDMPRLMTQRGVRQVEKVRFSHVVDPAHVCTLVVDSGARGRFSFALQQRRDPDRILGSYTLPMRPLALFADRYSLMRLRFF